MISRLKKKIIIFILVLIVVRLFHSSYVSLDFIKSTFWFPFRKSSFSSSSSSISSISGYTNTKTLDNFFLSTDSNVPFKLSLENTSNHTSTNVFTSATVPTSSEFFPDNIMVIIKRISEQELVLGLSMTEQNGTLLYRNTTRTNNSNRNNVGKNALEQIVTTLKSFALIESEIINSDNIIQDSSAFHNHFPIIPISGYRLCLKALGSVLPKKPTTITKAPTRSKIAYVGDIAYAKTSCSGCLYIPTVLNLREYMRASEAICKSKVLVCGPGSTFLCGLVGISVRTPVLIESDEYSTWPSYMNQFQLITTHSNGQSITPYGEAVLQHQNDEIVLANHRLFFERHTIQATHPWMLNTKGFMNVRSHKKDSGFNVYMYSDPKLCRTRKRNIPFRHGNMGDTMGTFLAEFIAQEMNMSFHVRCASDSKQNAIPPRDYHLTFGFIGSVATSITKHVNPNGISTNAYYNVALGIGFIDDVGSRGLYRKTQGTHVLGVRGPLTRDRFVLQYGINPEIVADPGLYFTFVFRELISAAQNRATGTNISISHPKRLWWQKNSVLSWKDLCFVSHEMDDEWFKDNLRQYQNVTIRAGKRGNGGDMYDAIKFLSTCRVVVSSSLHGVIFAHTLSVPAVPIVVSSLLHGGDFKFIDYYHGINLTSFRGRYSVAEHGIPKSTMEWVELAQRFVQPKFPVYIQSLRLLEIVKSLYTAKSL